MMSQRLTTIHHATTAQPTQPTEQHNNNRTTTARHTNQAHYSFQHRCRPTSFQVVRGLHRNTQTSVSCIMRTFAKQVHEPRSPTRVQIRAVRTERANKTRDPCHRHSEERERTRERKRHMRRESQRDEMRRRQRRVRDEERYT